MTPFEVAFGDAVNKRRRPVGVVPFRNVVRVRMLPTLLVYRYGGRSKLSEEGRCRMCLRPARVRKLTRHHVVKQTWFNRRAFVLVTPEGARIVSRHYLRDADAAVVPLCSPCHAEVETDVAARKMLRKLLAPVEVVYAIRLRGQDWFDAQYPPTRRASVRPPVSLSC